MIDRLSDVERVVVRDGCVASRVGSDTVVLQMNTGVYYGLNEVGTRVWELVSGGKALSDVVDAIVAEFDVTRERCEEDVTRLIADLERHELVRVELARSGSRR